MKEEQFNERIEMALNSMAKSPRPLSAYLLVAYPEFDPISESDIPEIIELLLSKNPNEPLFRKFVNLLLGWDNAQNPQWGEGTDSNSLQRRQQIYKLLQLAQEIAYRVDALIPRYSLEDPVVVAKKHEPWYNPQNSGRTFYWNAYSGYLKDKRGWSNDSVTNLDNATREVTSRLANPEAEDAYGSRGLVIGYVQSGKTANFTGVIAKAADAGYRLVIVLAGTWNMLRSQTQRRMDKELIGREILNKDTNYSLPRPEDWDQFISHGNLPSQLGAFDWERLTTLNDDFNNLGAALGALEFHPAIQGLRLNAPENLHNLPARLIVIKKQPDRLRKLVENLKAIRTRLADIPALVIDDESDQAGLNTTRQPTANSEKVRTSTNKAIVDLLQLLPRVQYVGYTATPYANVLVDPNDPKDLFPKDFIISLSRPEGYMGISDFFDADIDSDDLAPGDFSQKEKAFVRDGGDTEEGSLAEAVASYILSGAIKLYRASKNPEVYRFEHHTMLVHTGSTRAQHTIDHQHILGILEQKAFSSPSGLSILRKLWEEDYSLVSKAQAPSDLLPTEFSELKAFVGQCLDRLHDGKDIRVLNSDTDDAPDFNKENVWSIIVGGNKLSRGYTVEGLTISYYTRPTGQADSLMQMGRWFGFRKGYQDLVRIFIGRNEGRREVDLVDSFKQACLMEERFRNDVRRYSADGLTPLRPIDIPPLIEVSGDITPTSRNKMWNAVIQRKNFGNSISTSTLAPIGSGISKNATTAKFLWDTTDQNNTELLLGNDETTVVARCGTTLVSEVVRFLRNYEWLKGKFPPEMRLLADFLEKERHGINGFIVIAPQIGKSFGSSWYSGLKVKKRKRVAANGAFKIFGEPDHKIIARLIAGLTSEPGLPNPNKATIQYMNRGLGVFLLYPVREDLELEVSIGFEIALPPNDLPYGIQYTTRVDSLDLAAVPRD